MFNCIVVIIVSALTVLSGIEGQIRLREAPYQISVELRGGPVCGGAIIEAKWILTSAHCVTNPNRSVIPAADLIVRAGSNVRKSGGVAAKVKRVIVHENFVTINAANAFFSNNLALLELNAPLPISSPLPNNIKTIQIRGENVPDGSAVTAYGWGSTSPGRSEELVKITATTMSQNDCAQRTGDNSALITCIDRRLSPPCSGDDGGALVFNGQLVGIASSVRGCIAKPDSYSRLSKYTAWITGHMR